MRLTGTKICGTGVKLCCFFTHTRLTHIETAPLHAAIGTAVDRRIVHPTGQLFNNEEDEEGRSGIRTPYYLGGSRVMGTSSSMYDSWCGAGECFADSIISLSPTTMKPPICRVAIVGAQRQRVAKVAALLHSDESRKSLQTISLADTTTIKESSMTTTIEDNNTMNIVPKGVPVAIEIEYLPCVATFESYNNDYGLSVKYLAKLEYHGPNGALTMGQSLAPFFDSIDPALHFNGIAAVAIGCGIEEDGDVDNIRTYFAALSSCSEDNINTMIQCLKPNEEYASIKEENKAFRQMTENKKEEATIHGTLGSAKMATFAYSVAKHAVRQKWEKELTAYEQILQSQSTTEKVTTSTDNVVTTRDKLHCITPHIPNPELNRFACRKCRTALFGEEDLQDPPHSQSLHNFSKKMHKVGYGSAKSCQNHFIAQPLSWMGECDGVEGKLHCPKCKTKVGHYSWTGAQCSCGTWVTPAIMIPLSKVDVMNPLSQIVTATPASVPQSSDAEI